MEAKKAEFGFVFVYGGQDRNGNSWIKYRALAKTPEELYEAMKSWHSYGNSRDKVITPSDIFRHKVNMIFGIEPMDKWGNDLLKTFGCGAWGITWYPALAETLEGHEAIYNEKLQVEREERKRKAEEAKQGLKEEYSVLKRGWYYVCVEVQGLTIDNMRPRYFTMSGYGVADSKIDAYNKFTRDTDLINACARKSLTWSGYCSEWNSGDTQIEFLGMKTDDGYSIEEWEKFNTNH